MLSSCRIQCKIAIKETFHEPSRKLTFKMKGFSHGTIEYLILLRWNNFFHPIGTNFEILSVDHIFGEYKIDEIWTSRGSPVDFSSWQPLIARLNSKKAGMSWNWPRTVLRLTSGTMPFSISFVMPEFEEEETEENLCHEIIASLQKSETFNLQRVTWANKSKHCSCRWSQRLWSIHVYFAVTLKFLQCNKYFD